MNFRHLTGFLRNHGCIKKRALERSSSTYSRSKYLIVTLDPSKLAEKKQRRFHIGNLKFFRPFVALHNQSSPARALSLRLYYNTKLPVGSYPPDTTAFLYYFLPPGKPRIAGELRLRVASSDDHASFESGSDLLKLNGQPWSRSLYQVSKQYLPFYKKLREEGLVSDELNAVLSTFPPEKVPRCHGQLLYTLNDTFIVDFSFPGHRLIVITEQGVAVLKLLGPCIERRQDVKNQTPYTGSAFARFECSTLPEHKGTRTIVLRFLKIVTSVKCVIPFYDGHIRQPKEGELHRRFSKTLSRDTDRLNPPVWSVNIDKPRCQMGGIQLLLWEAMDLL